MSALGPHAGFILAAYGAVVVVLGGLAFAILRDHAAQRRALDALERRGAGRRSEQASPMSETPVPAPRRSPLPFVLPLVLFAALAVVFAIGLFSGDASKVPSALIGRPAPPVGFAALEGLQRNGRPVPALDVTELSRGRATIVNVFASWCAPCRVEHPFLMALAASAAVQQGKVALVGINYKDEAENARRFLGALGNPFSAVGVDRGGRAAIEWGVYGVPETFLIGGDGRILDKHVGVLDAETAGKLLARALSGK